MLVGPNAVGKTNVLEAIYELATGNSFRAENELDLLREGEKVCRIEGKTDGSELEIDWDSRQRFTKTYKVNGVGKRMVDFVGNLRVVLFEPQDIEIVADSPSTRRRYLDSVLNLVHKDYRVAAHIYERALRQRNRLLWHIRESGIRNQESREMLDYWNGLLINNGQVIHEGRREYLEFLSGQGELKLHYDHSTITQERLNKYAQEEVAAATTLVGPQRDDFSISKNNENVKNFGSRGEQRLAIFAIKLGELEYVRKITGEDPVLLLDDIFSELDQTNRHHVLKVIPRQQTIMTTTDSHLIEAKMLGNMEIIELK